MWSQNQQRGPPVGAPLLTATYRGTTHKGTNVVDNIYQLHSRRVHAAASTQRADPAKSRGTLQPVVSLGGRNADGGRRQSQTSWSRDRILRDPTLLGPESDAEPSLMMPVIIISFFFSE